MIDDDHTVAAFYLGASKRRREMVRRRDVAALEDEGAAWLDVGPVILDAANEKGFPPDMVAEVRPMVEGSRRSWQRICSSIAKVAGTSPELHCQLLSEACELIDGAFWAGMMVGSFESCKTEFLAVTTNQARTERWRAHKKAEAERNRANVKAALDKLRSEDPERWGDANAKDLAAYLAAGDLAMDERTIATHLKALGVPEAPSGKPGRPRSAKPKSHNTLRAVKLNPETAR